MRITHNKKRVNIGLEVRVHPSSWDEKKQRVRGQSEFATTTNALLNTCKTNVLKAYDVLLQKNITFSARDILDVYQGKDRIEVGFIEAFDLYLRDMKAKVGVGYKKPTLVKYTASRNILEKFLIYIGKADVLLPLVDRKLIADFDQYQRGVLKRQNNSVNKTHQQVKKMLKQCRINGWITFDPYDFYVSKSTPTCKEFLTFQELEPVFRFTSENKRLMTTRDIVLVMCLTGLAHTDMRNLKPENVRVGVDGKKWIEVRRQKTGVLTLVPVIPIVEEILTKYRSNPECVKRERVLPVPCSQVLNRSITLLLNAVGIRKHCTSHSFRYTFGSTVLAGTGVSLEIAGKMMGHSSLRSTQHYSKLSEKRLADAVATLGTLVEQNLQGSQQEKRTE